MFKPSTITVVLLLVMTGALGGTFLATRRPRLLRARAEPASVSDPALARAEAPAPSATASVSYGPKGASTPPVSPTPPGASTTVIRLDEATLMNELREMRQSDPELSLRMARDGNERFPSSPDAAERATIVVKSLMRMGRADEATAEARAMVERYPGTSWALDVKRHMLDVPSYVPDGGV